MNFKINHIQHIGIPVTDLNKSEMFYKKLGFENVMASGFEHSGGQGKMAMMQKREMIIEIYQFPDPALDEIRNRADGHVDDIDQAFAELKNASFRIVEDAPVFLPFWKNGCRYFNILGPDGERLEFNQIL
jgi:catechol 2,3-dioxygenase-like lactoylglutathione lyase family enzyme